MADLNGRVALVTGSGRGIGRSIALALAQAGADVAINYNRDQAAAEATAEEIARLGRKARIYAASVDDAEAGPAMVEAVVRDFGSLGILVNNAGIASRGQKVADTDPGEIERLFRVHALGPFMLSRAALPHLRKEDRSDIIMISSVATLYMAARGAPYNIGKAAMEALALTLAKEERDQGVRVNIVAPSLTVTEMGKRLTKARTGGAGIETLDATSPFGHVSTPEDVAAAVLWFASSDNSYCNGQKLNIDGGGA